MRIISQDRYYDIPYETCNLEVAVTERNGRTEICCHSNSHARCMGVYSTPEKALKAMEMLHQAYTGSFIGINAEFPEGEFEKIQEMLKHGYGILTVQTNGDTKTEFKPLNICFQFPQDSEVDA